MVESSCGFFFLKLHKLYDIDKAFYRFHVLPTKPGPLDKAF